MVLEGVTGEGTGEGTDEGTGEGCERRREGNMPEWCYRGCDRRPRQREVSRPQPLQNCKWTSPQGKGKKHAWMMIVERKEKWQYRPPEVKEVFVAVFSWPEPNALDVGAMGLDH
eukprot:1148719-Pelagomonas_calceolata.AAC.2